MEQRRPLIGVVADVRDVDGWPFHMAGEKYLTAVTDAVGGVPVIVPALSGSLAIDAWLSRLDGVLITGSLSNVEPRRYGGPPSRPGTLHDPARDAMTLPLVDAALESGLPMLAICRGFQEVNVAMGGTLHQHLNEVAGHLNHEADPALPIPERYGPRHDIRIVSDGLLHRIADTGVATVNSLHQQGVDRLAAGLTVEALAPDGVVEAFTVDGAAGFNLAVQWHPEFRPLDNALSTAIFRGFGEACRGDTVGR